MPISPQTLRRYASNRVFVETGSYVGDCIQFALDAGFERVFSVEVSRKYVDYCLRRFAERPEVVVVHGDSEDVLWDVIKDIGEPVTFWLDGHYSGDDATTRGRSLSPLVKELEAIARHQVRTHTILVDDMRCWREERNAYHEGFDVESLTRRILEINPSYRVEFVDGEACNSLQGAGVVSGVDVLAATSRCNGRNGEVFPGDILAATVGRGME